MLREEGNEYRGVLLKELELFELHSFAVGIAV